LLTDESRSAPANTYYINGFNPRPSLLTDESTDSVSAAVSQVLFQSTSVIADGRIT